MDLFTHEYENKVSNIEIYNEQKPRLKVNCWVILFVLLEGRKLSAIDVVGGIKFKGMERPKYMVEFRKRIMELRDAGIDIRSIKLSSGCKEHFIYFPKLNEYRFKYLPYMSEVLSKLK